MTGSDSELSPELPSGARILSGLKAGAVFVRKSAVLPDALQNVGNSIVLGWRWIVLNEAEFHAALKTAGWRWYILGEPGTVKVFGSLTNDSVGKLIEKVLLTIHNHNPNTFTVTGIRANNTLGLKSVSLSFQARHVQRAIPSKASAPSS